MLDQERASAPRIVAAVMTYNRAAMLQQCMAAIGAQTLRPEKTIVLDNASTDGTSALLSREFPDVIVIRMPQNVGCAGAMRELLRKARTHRPDYVWFLDDDVIALPACLETLVREMSRLESDCKIGVLRPMIQDSMTGDTAGGGTTQAALLSGAMIQTVDLPDSELFIELSDHSYNRQIRATGYQILRLPLVLAQHPIHRPRKLREMVSEGFRTKPWRLYYAVRNRIYFSLYVERSAGRFLRHLAVAARTLVLVTLFGRPPRGQSLIFRGVVDGVLGRLGRRVDPSY